MERYTDTKGVWQRVICGIGQFARNIDKRISSIRIDTGAWVSELDVDPGYWQRKAEMEAALRATFSDEEIDAFRTDGVRKRVLSAQEAIRTGRIEQLPMKIRIKPAE